MLNGNTLTLDACVLGGGIIYDDGGSVGEYSNSFDGYVLIQAATGITITVTGYYQTEAGCDFLTIQDGTTTLLHASGYDTVHVSTTTGQLMIGFHSDGSVIHSGFMLNWSVSGISDQCPNAVTNLDTVGCTMTSIGLTWNAVNTTGPFTVVCNDQIINGVTTNSYTLTGLNPSTTYDISVVASASSSNRCCAGHIKAHTACGSAMMPYSDGFEITPDGGFPDCWIQLINFDDEGSMPQVVSSHHSAGDHSLMLSCGNTNTAEHYGIVATPPIAGSGSHTVRLQMRTSHYGTVVEFGLCDSIGDEYNLYGFTPIQNIYLNNTNSWQQYTFTWNTTDEGHRLALRMLQSNQGSTAGRRVYIDDMGVEACGVDDLSTSMVEHDRVTLQWSSFGNPTCNVGVRQYGALVDDTTLTNVTSPLLITGLQASTEYVFTVYPTCSGSLNISRSTNATTTAMPNMAEGYCSDFRTTGQIPDEWTTRHISGGCGTSFYYEQGIRVYNGCSGADLLVVSGQMNGLAGKTVTVSFYGEENGATITLGTMLHPDNLASFVPLDSVTSDGLRHTITATVPANSTGRHIALRATNPGWYIAVTYTSVAVTPCAVEEPHVYHRRGTTMDIGWAMAYDTVLVQYGLEGFTLGTGIIDTFYSTATGTLTGLTPGANYDLFIYRPCQPPCEDLRYTRRTAQHDYPLPYCENFSMLNSYSWEYNYSDWIAIDGLNNNPSFVYHPYYSYAGRALRMSSWGFSWGYYSTVMLPDVEVDSNTYMSFYIYDEAPTSTLVIGALLDEYRGPYGSYNYEHIQVLDTIHINAHYKRTHYTYHFRPSDTLFRDRITLRYIHPQEFSYYNCYVDELQLGHTSYGTLQNTYIGFDTVGFNLTSLQGANSVEITLTGGGNTIVDTIALANIHSFGFGGLDTGTIYQCYVRPLDEGCSSYAGYVITHSYGAGGYYGDCYDFSTVLSYELPSAWAADSTTLVNSADHLELPAHSSVAMHPVYGRGDQTFSFRAYSSVQGDTLLLGTLPASSIHLDSTHFTFNTALFSVVDTFVIGSQWDYYMLRLPSTGTDTVRYTFRIGNGTTELDDIGFSWCPIVHFDVEGNTIVCRTDNDQATTYILRLEDSTGDDERTIYVETNPYRVTSLSANRRYDITWRCLNIGEDCRPTVSVRTDNRVPLPYCEDFNQPNSSLNLPTTWSFIKGNPYAYIELSTNGPSIYVDPAYYSNSWTYIVLPELEVDSALTLTATLDCPGGGNMQIGVMSSATDTASFQPLWTSPMFSGNTYWMTPYVDFSGHTSGRVALRLRYQRMYIHNLHLYGYPLATASLLGAGKIRLTTTVDKPYWLQNNIGCGGGGLSYVDTSVFYLYDTNCSWAYITQVCDSTGYTCDNERYYNLGWRENVPYCYNSNWTWPGFFYYQPDGQSSIGWQPVNGNYYMRFNGNTSQWVVLPEMNVDSLKRLGMGVEYYATSAPSKLVVGVMTDAYDTSTFTPVDTLVYYSSGDSMQVDLTYFENYNGNGRWVALHHPCSTIDGDIFLRNIMIDACPASLGAKASLSRWNQVKIDAPRTPFYMEYGVSSNSQGDGNNTILRVDSVPLILTLNPETRYNFYFRCDSVGYTCMPVQQVVTLGAPLDVPTCVDFDTVKVGTNPHNWTSRNVGIGVANTLSHSGDKSLQIPVGVNSYIITPDINIDSIQKVSVSVWYRVEDLSDRLVVGVVSDPTDLNTFHPLRSLAPVAVGTWQHGMIEFSNAPGDAHFIALSARSNRQAGGRNIYVDDINVSTCAAFDLRVQTLQSGSIDLAWSQIGNPDITVTMEDNGMLIGTYTNVTTPLHIEPLSLQHYYTFRLTSICDSNDTGYCSTNYYDSVSVVAPAPSTGCVNPTDLASPQSVFFRGTYNNPYAHAGAVNYGSLHPDSRHTVCYDTAQRDPRTGNQLRTIPEGYTSSVRLGNWSTNAFEPEAEGVIYSLLVDTAAFELLLLRYAAVLQDPLHASADQPRFRMELLDTNYNIIDSACTSADFIADQSLGWNVADDGVLWKDWTAVGVDLSSHAGEHVYFRLTTYDCNEGSHYGYAYFTLECMRKNTNTISCGDVDSNTLSAPEGFHYRWYTSQSTATVSTAQSITVPSEDITYYCEVSKLDNASCQFIISAYGGTRYPIAAFDTAIVIDSCRFYVNFTNLSGVSRDGINLIPGENCETALWDFGNGTISTRYHGYVVYTLPGTYIVRLISGIAYDACQDTAEMTLVLEIPSGMRPSDTTAASICDNQHYTFFSQSYNTPGEYYEFVDVPNQTCDSLYVLQLDVRATSSSDSIAVVCDSITWRGQTYTVDGTYSSGPIGLNAVGCDTSVNLVLTVHPTYDTADPIIVCPYERYVYRGVDYGGPAVIDTVLYSIYNCDSVVHVTLTPRDTTFHLAPYYYFDSLPTLVPDTMLISCAPSTLYLIDSTQGVTQWSWMLFTPDTTVNGITSAFTYAFETGRDSVSAYLTLVTTSEGDCLDTIGWPVFVFPSPVADFRWLPERPSILHSEVQFHNLTTPQRNEIDSLHALTYLWHIQTTVGGEFDTTSVFEPHYQWGEQGDNMAGDYTVQLIVSWTHPADSFYFEDMLPWVDPAFYHAMLYPAFTHTCVDTSEQTVTITNEYLQFPNLVSPNGDGVNDRWEVVNLLEMGDYPMNELWVYDRTGALVYHVKNIRRAEQFWDPNATRSPDGTYYYRFMAEGDYGVVKRNGTIEVLRK